MELIDTHCHLTFEPLINNVAEVVERSKAAGVGRWITVGTGMADNRAAVKLAGQYENIYAAVGIHPHYASEATDEDLDELAILAASEKVVAIGETGLDFHYNFSKQEAQERIFIAQLEIAAEASKPVIVHSRQAYKETMRILEQHGSGVKRIVFHCYSYSAQQAREILSRGYYISFTGVVTFKNAQAAREAAKAVPVERMMLETDCPYMSPEPMRKQKVNEPGLLIYTARRVAEAKGMDVEQLSNAVTKTSKEFFKLK